MVDHSRTPHPPVTPSFGDSGNISAATVNPGTTYVPFAQTACAQLTIVNDTGTDVEFQQDGAGVAVPVTSATYFRIKGIHDASQIGVRRKDTSNTVVTVKARWEK